MPKVIKQFREKKNQSKTVQHKDRTLTMEAPHHIVLETKNIRTSSPEFITHADILSSSICHWPLLQIWYMLDRSLFWPYLAVSVIFDQHFRTGEKKKKKGGESQVTIHPSLYPLQDYNPQPQKENIVKYGSWGTEGFRGILLIYEFIHVKRT